MASDVAPLRYDAVVVGSGPNGITAAVLLAQAGLSVLLLEADTEPGGGCRSAAFTLPGYVHDICSAVHPLGLLSPVFQHLGLGQAGVRWASAEFPLVHPLPDGSAAVLCRSVNETARKLPEDRVRWTALFAPLATEEFIQSLLYPVWDLGAGELWKKAWFGLVGLRSCAHVARSRFTSNAARALFAGCAAHSVMPLDAAGTASFGMVLALAGQVADWPCAVGGSAEITRALLRLFSDSGGRLETGRRISRFEEIPPARAVLFDLNPRQVAAICGSHLPGRYRARLEAYRHGPGIFKVDWALDGPIPWRNAECARAMTVHVCGGFDDVLAAEAAAWRGTTSDRPFVLVAQQSAFDHTRSPGGGHTGWAYCHVPNGSTTDMTEPIESAIERFAPGFRDRIRARRAISPTQLEMHNAAMPGGDMAGGANDLRQFLFRPVPRWNPYATPNPRVFLASSSTPPGGGVHGMCGYHAARTALRRVFGRPLRL